MSAASDRVWKAQQFERLAEMRTRLTCKRDHHREYYRQALEDLRQVHANIDNEIMQAWMDGWTLDDIAQALGVVQSSVSKRMKRIRNQPNYLPVKD